MNYLSTVVFLLLLSLNSHAATIVVTNTNNAGAGSLRDAISNSNNTDTIRFNPNLISGGSDTIILTSELNFVKNLVFKGLYNANDTLYISGNNTNRIFYVDFTASSIVNKAITIDSIALINGAASGNGGAIYFKHGDSLVVNNSLISGNTASSAGGAIYAYAFSAASMPLTVTINNSTVSGNTANTSGGGIYSNSNSNTNFSVVTVSNSTIFGNTANSGSGGGIYSNSNSNTANFSTVTVSNSTVSGNMATSGFGGGIYSKANSNASNAASTVTVSNCTINGNSSYASGGGGIYSRSTIVDYNSNASSVSTVSVDNCDISGNGGGGIYSYSSSGDYYSTSASSIVTVNKSTINGNTATAGGAIASTASAAYTGVSIYSTITLDSTTISGNTTTAAGGGIYSKSSSHSTVTANYCTISGNSSSYYGGGGIYSNSKYASTVTLDNCTISENTAVPFGGGIYSYSDYAAYSSSSISSVNLSKCTMFGNSAVDDGGGIYSKCYFNTSEVILENSTIYGNTAGSDGEGIYSQAPISRIFPKSCIVAHNGVNNIFNNSINTIGSQGYNIFSDAPNGYNLTNDQINIDSISLNLLPIASNGGATQTMLPGTGSFAINMGNPVDLTDAQNAAIFGIRDVGAAESDCKSYLLNEVISCESYTWAYNGQTYVNDTIISDTIVAGNINGCDSILTLSLDIKNVNVSMSSIVACDSYMWPHNGQIYVSDTTVIDTLLGAGTYGCDSVVTLNLTMSFSTAVIDVQSACDTYTWIDGNTYASSNNSVTHTLTNAAGCDSVVTLNLTMNSSTTGTDVQSACDSYTWLDGITYTSSVNTPTWTLTNAAGCDSIVTLNLTINSFPDVNVTQSGPLLTATQIGANYQWLNCDDNNAMIVGETNQAYTPIPIIGNYAVQVDLNGCIDTSSCFLVDYTGLSEMYKDKLSVYPNPAEDKLTINGLDEVVGFVRIEFISSNGKLESTIISPMIEIDISELTAGVHFINIVHEQGIESLRFIKK